ncbi:MAG: glycosyltransferase family 4 protein [Terriglobia bacterium]
MKACFFVRVGERDILERVEAYKQDIDILRELRFEVVLSTCWDEIPTDADFYFIYWWQWGFLPMMKGIIRRRPCLITGVFDFRWPVGNCDYFHRPAWQQWLMQYSLKHAAANVFVSELEYREVTRALKVNNPLYIPHAVDPAIYREGTGARENFVLDIVMMTQGNSRRKCVPEIIKAIPLVRDRHPEVRFVFAGNKGSDYAGLARMVSELGLEGAVDFPGVISREQKVNLLQRCKVYVSPAWYEGFGMAILEAMSCGTPVVSSPVGALPEVVGDAGLLVDGRSPEAIAGGINRYLDNEALRGEMGYRGRQRAVTLFPYSRRRRELEKVISEILEKN